MQVQPYLFFEGRCEEAAEHYRTALGAEIVHVTRVGDVPQGEMGPPLGSEDKILHMTLRIGESTIMASDGSCGGSPSFQGISLALTLPDPAEAERVFAALAEGGQVTMPLSPTFFSTHFGMVSDRFGVAWMISVAP